MDRARTALHNEGAELLADAPGRQGGDRRGDRAPPVHSGLRPALASVTRRRRRAVRPKRAAFIRANTRLLAPPLAPDMRLHLADEAVALWTKTEAELQASGLPPPFWAFAWAGGQALARWIGDHPEPIAGRRVLDFASGSGIVAIAAALAGAAKRRSERDRSVRPSRDRAQRERERRRRRRAVPRT